MHSSLKADLEAANRSYDVDFIPAVVEDLVWTIGGPKREGKPEDFMIAVMQILRRKADEKIGDEDVARDPSPKDD